MVVIVIREIADLRVSTATIEKHLVVAIIVHVDAIIVVIKGDAKVLSGRCSRAIRTVRETAQWNSTALVVVIMLLLKSTLTTESSILRVAEHIKLFFGKTHR